MNVCKSSDCINNTSSKHTHGFCNYCWDGIVDRNNKFCEAPDTKPKPKPDFPLNLAIVVIEAMECKCRVVLDRDTPINFKPGMAYNLRDQSTTCNRCKKLKELRV